MTTPGSSTTSASADRRRRAWVIAVCLYGLAATLDLGVHLAELRAEHRRIAYPDVAVAFSASLFWPVDLVARALLRH